MAGLEQPDDPTRLAAAVGSRVSIEQKRDSAGTPVVALTGELDLSSADSLRATIDSIVATGPNKIIFELSALAFMDSSGLAVLLTTAQQIATVEIANPSDIVRRVIELTGLSSTLRMTP